MRSHIAIANKILRYTLNLFSKTCILTAKRFRTLFQQNKRTMSIILLVILTATPVLISSTFKRLTVFRVFGSTEHLQVQMDSSIDAVAPQIGFIDAEICFGENFELNDTLSETCPGYEKRIQNQSGSIVIINPGTLSLIKTEKGTNRYEFNPSNDSNPQCNSPDWILKNSDGKIQGHFCGRFRSTLETVKQNELAWTILRSQNISIGQDLRHTDHIGKPGFITGSLEIYGLSLRNDIAALTDWFEADASGYKKLTTYNMQLGEVVRFSQKQNSHLVARISSDGSINITAWVVADFAIVSSFGAPDRSIGVDWFLRLANDPLLTYWIMGIFALLFSLFRINVI